MKFSSSLIVAALSLVFYLSFLVSRGIAGFRGIGFLPERTPLYGYSGIFAAFWFILFCALLVLNKGEMRRIVVPLMAASLGGLASWLWNFQILVLLLPAAAIIFPLLKRDFHNARLFILLLIATGVILAISVDVFYVRDAYAPPYERYNTIMKVYLMQWVFLGLASSYSLSLMIQFLRGKTKLLLVSLAMLLIAASLIHPVASTASWTSGKPALFGPGRGTLNGLAYLKQTQESDYLAIQWLNKNVRGSPVILEAPSETAIGVYSSRVSSLTGLPTLTGWGPWEVQWGRSWEQIQERASDTSEIYNSMEANDVLVLIRKNCVDYIYIGELERQEYSSRGLSKFAAAPQYFEKVYDHGGVEIYRVL
jgi:YYY domain-containing protein